VSTIYLRALGDFAKPRKFGRSSLWVTAELNDWIARRTAGVPLEIDDGSKGLPGNPADVSGT
jgi:hypothetical protein